MTTGTIHYERTDLPEVEVIYPEYRTDEGRNNTIYQVGDYTFDSSDDWDEDYILSVIYANIAWLKYIREN